MSDFEPITDFPDLVDQSDLAVPSSARLRDERIQRRRRQRLGIVVAVGAVGLIIAGYGWWRVVVAAGVAYLSLRVGLSVLGSFARPVPEPPPPGELRRVKLTYRCASCGSELRMTLANDQVPQPPRHCADEMELTTALEDV